MDETASEDARRLYARMMMAASNSADPRLERVFALVRREAFLPPGPWKISTGSGYVETPSADPVHLYQNVLVALDAARGINNGEPALHAAWIGAAAPAGGETVCHIGAGGGYYTAILSLLVLPGGRVEAFEIDDALAAMAARNLEPFGNVKVVHGDASRLPLPPSDLIYVNAGVVAPPLSWLAALRDGGRLIFPWTLGIHSGVTLLVTRRARGFSARPLMMTRFIPCIGASDPLECQRATDTDGAFTVRSVRLRSEAAPDDTAVAVYRNVWFSSAPV